MNKVSEKKLTIKGEEYLILDKVGEGMSGVVYQVLRPRDLKLRAIRCVDLSKMDKESAQSCVQEIEMMIKLQGQSIIKIYDFEINNHEIYVVLGEENTDPRCFLKATITEETLKLATILFYWTEMLAVVKYIHDHGVIHSDLKPDNFLIVKGKLSLTDLGIASKINRGMASVVKNTTCGTLNYISPEALVDIGESPNQHSKYKISYKSDVWSLGCILYSFFYGRAPFQHIEQYSTKMDAVINADLNISFAQPSNFDPIPPVFVDVMKKCLQHNPEARPSVDELLHIHYIPIEPSRNILNIYEILMNRANSLSDKDLCQLIEIIEKLRNS